MTSRIDPEEVFSWLRIPTEELEGQSKARLPIKIQPTQDDVPRWTVRKMADEVKANNLAMKAG
jgi:hypothetical protein